MWTAIFTTAVSSFFKLLSLEMLRVFIDKGCDGVEDYAKATPNKVDDAIFLPACAILRKLTNTPDND